jgi:hypothetical protein
MKNKKIYQGLLVALIVMHSYAMGSTESTQGKTYLAQLEAISHVEGMGNNALLTLIRKAATELASSWSPELAQEIARVFNELISVNSNYFLVELIEPVLIKHPEKFTPILMKALSEENKQRYREMLDMHHREEIEGNG